MKVFSELRRSERYYGTLINRTAAALNGAIPSLTASAAGSVVHCTGAGISSGSALRFAAATPPSGGGTTEVDGSNDINGSNDVNLYLSGTTGEGVEDWVEGDGGEEVEEENKGADDDDGNNGEAS